MDIEPATLAQVKRGQNGEFIAIDNDVQNVAQDLLGIHPNLKLRYSELGQYFVVYKEWMHPVNGLKQELVTTAKSLDQRLVKRVRHVMSAEYDFLKEAEKMDKKADADARYKFEEAVGEKAEELAHALREDLGYKKDVSRSSKKWGKGLVGHA